MPETSVHATPQPLTTFGTRSNLKRKTAVLNSEFSIPKTACLSKAKNANLSHGLSIANGYVFTRLLHHECGGYCCSVNIFGLNFVVVCLVDSLFSTIILVSVLKSKRSKTTQTKEHSKQSNINKIKFIYLQIHEKRNITNILI